VTYSKELHDYFDTVIKCGDGVRIEGAELKSFLDEIDRLNTENARLQHFERTINSLSTMFIDEQFPVTDPTKIGLKIVAEFKRLDTETAANKWVSVSEIKNTHSGNRVLIQMVNDYVVIATYYKDGSNDGYFRNDNGDIVAFNDVIQYTNLPIPPAGGE